MNKRGQMAIVFFAILFVLTCGLQLYIFHDSIEQVRLDALNQPYAQNAIVRMILYALQPLLWGAWLILGTFAVVSTANNPG